MSGFAVLLKKEIRENWRTGRLPVVAVIFLLFGLASPVIARYTPEIVRLAAGPIAIPLPTPTTRDAVAQLIKNLNQVGVLTAVLLAMGSVASEKESGTAGFVLTKPVSRLAFLAAKFCGLGLTMAVAVAVCGLAAYAYTDILFAPLPAPGYVLACLAMLLILLEIAAITFLGSVLMRTSIPAAGIGVAAVVIAGILASVPRVGDFTPFGLNQMARDLALGQVRMEWQWQVGANLGVLALALGASWVVFRRQEL